jgi:hypothetical protein
MKALNIMCHDVTARGSQQLIAPPCRQRIFKLRQRGLAFARLDK